jgi:hypothetical protein
MVIYRVVLLREEVTMLLLKFVWLLFSEWPPMGDEVN